MPEIALDDGRQGDGLRHGVAGSDDVVGERAQVGAPSIPRA
jgi:hypothetical protein